jgi:alpha-tubulin suppressor-like RCC1 family protein
MSYLNTIFSNHALLKKTIKSTLEFRNIPKDIIILIISFLQDIKFFSNDSAFALLTSNGDVYTWGDQQNGGNSQSVQHLLKNVISIHSSRTAFAAIIENNNDNNEVVTWGNPYCGGNCNNIKDKLKNVVNVYAGKEGFVAICKNGNIVSWGRYTPIPFFFTNFISVESNGSAFVGITDNDELYGWIDDSVFTSKNNDQITNDYMTNNILSVYHNPYSFVAIKEDHSVVAFGNDKFGGNIDNNLDNNIASKLKNVLYIKSTFGAYTALLDNGTVVSWGSPEYGGDNSSVKSKLDENYIIEIYSTNSAFAARTQNGKVIRWGHQNNGGDSGDSRDTQLERNKILSIYSNSGAFLAICENSTVIIWGSVICGGCRVLLKEKETDTILSVHPTSKAFAIFYSSGTVVVQGHSRSILHNIESIYTCSNAYLFVKKNGINRNNRIVEILKPS